jgi:hypothetical protein
MRSSVALALLLLALGGGGSSLAAQQPAIANGAVTAQAAPAPFVQGFTTLVAGERGPLWIGYTVPSTRQHDSCCCDEMTTSHRTKVSLEGATTLSVLFRVAEGRVERVRMFSRECELDAGGLPVRWLEQVRPADSIALLASLAGAGADRKDRVTGGALAAMAMHAEPAAGDALIRLARAHASTKVRGDALFWLAQRAGQQAVATLTKAVEEDPDTEVKRRAVFALSQLPGDEGVPLLIKVARTNPNPAVKKQAMFWLGQSKDPRAIDFFAEVLAR